MTVWSARLHHVALRAPDAEATAAWYADRVAMSRRPAAEGWIVLEGAERALAIRESEAGLAHIGWALPDARALAQARSNLVAGGFDTFGAAAPFFSSGTFGLRDPDGHTHLFGAAVAPASGGSAPAAARLQHVGLQTQRLQSMRSFFEALGWRASDIVRDDQGDDSAIFLRSYAEHHSLALFRSAKTQLDHFCFETASWNDIRDWSDHMAARRQRIVWGAGRHGAGNNLFVFVEDPIGVAVEFSAELAEVPDDAPPNVWRHEERTLNLWGGAWLRS